MMSIDQHLPDTSSGATGQLSLTSLWSHLVICARTCADYYNAATAYEQLSHLSNAELQRRGLKRETLARDVVAAHDRATFVDGDPSISASRHWTAARPGASPQWSSSSTSGGPIRHAP